VSRPDLTRVELLVNIRFPGSRAHGIQVAAMAEALSATGMNVDVVAPRRFPYRERDVFEHYGVRRTFGVQRIASLDTIDMLPPRWQRAPFLLQSLTFGWRALVRMVLQRDTGVLVRDHYTLMILFNGLRRRDRARLAAEVHNLPAPGARRNRLMRALRSLPAVITINHALRDDLVAEGVEPAAVLVAHDGVHVSRYDELPDVHTARAHLQLPDMPTVAYAGQLYRWKGVDTLIEAMVELRDAQLLIVGGDGPDLHRLVELATRLAPGRVHFTGTVPHTAVPFHLAAGDVIALPNSAEEEISARFTSPLKLFEAMATGRPIVASDLASLREVLVHDENALLVPPDDRMALAHGIAQLLPNDERAQRLAAQARLDVEAYDWAERGGAVARFLREKLGLGGP